MTEATTVRVSVKVEAELFVDIVVDERAEARLGKPAHEIAYDYVLHSYLCGNPVTWRMKDMKEPDVTKLEMFATEVPDTEPMVLTGSVRDVAPESGNGIAGPNP